MKQSLCFWTRWLGCVLVVAGCIGASSGNPAIDSRNLPNGIRVVSIHVQASTNVSIFTFLPAGLASDGADQAQWSHLV
ncbi:MAG TPA: hypothetical protein VMS21_10560, partial [Methylomirabilota bacterium]|nr:hypothetical protein [Methylomirabilota bacterium]